MCERDRSMTRSNRRFAAPSGIRILTKEKSDTLRPTTTRCRRQMSRVIRRRRTRTCCWSRTVSKSTTSTVTKSVFVCFSHPLAVDLGTPCLTARSRSPVVRTRMRRRWSYRCWVRVEEVMPKWSRPSHSEGSEGRHGDDQWPSEVRELMRKTPECRGKLHGWKNSSPESMWLVDRIQLWSRRIASIFRLAFAFSPTAARPSCLSVVARSNA